MSWFGFVCVQVEFFRSLNLFHSLSGVENGTIAASDKAARLNVPGCDGGPMSGLRVFPALPWLTSLVPPLGGCRCGCWGMEEVEVEGVRVLARVRG